MKPNIKRKKCWGGVWVCESKNFIGMGFTLQDAYNDWLDTVRKIGHG